MTFCQNKLKRKENNLKDHSHKNCQLLKNILDYAYLYIISCYKITRTKLAYKTQSDQFLFLLRSMYQMLYASCRVCLPHRKGFFEMVEILF